MVKPLALIAVPTTPSKKPMRKYLIIGPSWVGDMVMSQSLYRYIKELHPDAQIDVMAPDFCRPLLNMMPEVTEALSLPFKHGDFSFGKRKALGKSLKEKGYTHALTLPNSWKSALIPYFAKVPVRTGWKGESRYILLNDCRPLDKEKYPLMIQRFCALAIDKNETLPDKLPVPKLLLPQADLEATRQKFQVADGQQALALCPGAEFGPAKQWLAEHYAEVGRTFRDRGFQVWLFGSKGDLAIANEIQSLVGEGVRNFAGETSLPEAMHLLSMSTKVVSNDSGLMHISAALGRPVVVVYGSTSPGFTPPLSQKSKIVHTDVSCRPCFKRECPLNGDAKLKCLIDLPPQQVIQALDEL